MKLLIFIVIIFSSLSLFSYERIEINYPGYQKYSLDNGKSWVRVYPQISIIYPEYHKISYDNGVNWTLMYNDNDSRHFGITTQSNCFEVHNINFFDFKLKDYRSFRFYDKNFMLLESGNIKENQLFLNLKDDGIYYLFLNGRNARLMIKVLKNMK